jgi:hypothetical protein
VRWKLWLKLAPLRSFSASPGCGAARNVDRLREELDRARKAHNELFDRVTLLEAGKSGGKPA